MNYKRKMNEHPLNEPGSKLGLVDLLETASEGNGQEVKAAVACTFYLFKSAVETN